MIEGFRHKGLQRLYHKGDRKALPASSVDKIARMLARLDIATGPDAMNLPGWKLHPLKGDYQGFWAVWVSGNWRLVFRFNGTQAADVDLVDYH